MYDLVNYTDVKETQKDMIFVVLQVLKEIRNLEAEKKKNPTFRFRSYTYIFGLEQ